MGIPFPAAGAALLLSLGCAGPTVRIPTADPTPPLSALNVVGSRGERLVLLSGEGPRTVELGPGDSLVLIGLGEDRDGGVKDLALLGNAVAHCGEPARRVPHARKQSPSLKSGSFARRSVLPALPGWRVPGSKSTRYVLKADDFRKLCGPLELKGVTGAAGVRAINYHGKSAMSPTLKFRIAPPPERAKPPSQASQASQIPQPVHEPLPAGEIPATPRI